MPPDPQNDPLNILSKLRQMADHANGLEVTIGELSQLQKGDTYTSLKGHLESLRREIDNHSYGAVHHAAVRLNLRDQWFSLLATRPLALQCFASSTHSPAWNK